MFTTRWSLAAMSVGGYCLGQIRGLCMTSTLYGCMVVALAARDAMFMVGAPISGSGWMPYSNGWHGRYFMSWHGGDAAGTLSCEETLVWQSRVSVGVHNLAVFTRPNTAVYAGIVTFLKAPSWSLLVLDVAPGENLILMIW
ncbi:hypothetical protein VPH35_112646 [Triticum aestivum]